ncbi:hypothetical protein N9X28_00525 [Candidatus Poseidoniales archaeon]|nr:hypothetical protein [Candidatus Poseidoniales archaeon]MDC3317487.1 hypothetical protein [Candidatus Poseidoniaceae archaeon]
MTDIDKFIGYVSDLDNDEKTERQKSNALKKILQFPLNDHTALDRALGIWEYPELMKIILHSIFENKKKSSELIGPFIRALGEQYEDILLLNISELDGGMFNFLIPKTPRAIRHGANVTTGIEGYVSDVKNKNWRMVVYTKYCVTTYNTLIHYTSEDVPRDIRGLAIRALGKNHFEQAAEFLTTILGEKDVSIETKKYGIKAIFHLKITQNHIKEILIYSTLVGQSEFDDIMTELESTEQITISKKGLCQIIDLIYNKIARMEYFFTDTKKINSIFMYKSGRLDEILKHPQRIIGLFPNLQVRDIMAREKVERVKNLRNNTILSSKNFELIEKHFHLFTTEQQMKLVVKKLGGWWGNEDMMKILISQTDEFRLELFERCVKEMKLCAQRSEGYRARDLSNVIQNMCKNRIYMPEKIALEYFLGWAQNIIPLSPEYHISSWDTPEDLDEITIAETFQKNLKSLIERNISDDGYELIQDKFKESNDLLEKYQLLVFIITRFIGKSEVSIDEISSFFAKEIGGLPHEIIFNNRNKRSLKFRYDWVETIDTHGSRGSGFCKWFFKPYYINQKLHRLMNTEQLSAFFECIPTYKLEHEKWTREDIHLVVSTIIEPYEHGSEEILGLANEILKSNKYGMEYLIKQSDYGNNLINLIRMDAISSNHLKETITSSGLDINVKQFNDGLTGLLKRVIDSRYYDILYFLCAFPHEDSFDIIAEMQDSIKGKRQTTNRYTSKERNPERCRGIISQFVSIHSENQTYYGDVKLFIERFSTTDQEG